MRRELNFTRNPISVHRADNQGCDYYRIALWSGTSDYTTGLA
nr:hypothetical protein [uncultured Undibacterium sp.]